MMNKVTINLYSPITRKKNQSVIQKIHPANKCPGPHGFMGEFYQTFTEDLISVFLKLFQKIEKDRIFQTHFTRRELPLDQNQTRIPHQRKLHRPTSLMDMDANTLRNISKPNSTIH